MSEPLSNLEVEPEWCSVAMLTSITDTDVPIDSPTAASVASLPIEPVPSEPVMELSTSVMVESSESPKLDVTPEKPKRSASKSRSESKSSQPRTSAPPAGSSRWVGALRSRRLRVVATVASVLLVAGLIVLNQKSDSSNSGDGFVEMDLSDFNDVAGFDEPHTGTPSESPPRGTLADAESVSPAERFPRMTSGPRLPPLGLVTHADHETPLGQTTRGLVPASATSTGSRGAVLTGRIEFDAPQRPAETSAGPFRNLGMR